MAAHLMFALPVIDFSMKVRTGGAQWFAEFVAAVGLVATILAGIKFQRGAVPWLVGLYITAAYWFTASTSFANPAVAIARSLTNTFSGIRPIDLPGFIVAELCGAFVGMLLMNWMLGRAEVRGAGKNSGDIVMTITIYHNPDCGTSRNTLAMIRKSGIEPTVIEYLKTPPSRDKLKELVAAMGISVRALLREKGTPYKELGLDDPKWTDDELIDQMLAHPILINRPIVVTPKGVRLCRPSEAVLDILPNPDIGRFVKEDGEVVNA
jgi:arsenate reductase (glutaredoxin)